MSDLILRQAAINNAKELFRMDKGYCDEYSILDMLNQLPSAQPDIMHIIQETLAECGIYGEESTIMTCYVLKRLGRSDLLPPCMR